MIAPLVLCPRRTGVTCDARSAACCVVHSSSLDACVAHSVYLLAFSICALIPLLEQQISFLSHHHYLLILLRFFPLSFPALFLIRDDLHLLLVKVRLCSSCLLPPLVRQRPASDAASVPFQGPLYFLPLSFAVAIQGLLDLR